MPGRLLIVGQRQPEPLPPGPAAALGPPAVPSGGGGGRLRVGGMRIVAAVAAAAEREAPARAILAGEGGALFIVVMGK